MMGFTKAEELDPDYFYWKSNGNLVRAKQNMKKSDLIPQMDIPCQDMNEREMAEHLGWYRVYDCGKIRWELNM